MNKKLYRDEHNKVFGGVCSGLAQYFDIDVTIVRLLFAFTFFVMGVGFGTYIILWIVLPRKGYPYPNFNNPTVDYTVPPQQPTGNFNAGQQGSNPFGGNQFGGNPFGGNPYSNPIDNTVPKQRSHAGVIIGAVLIFIGAAILIDNYDLLPDFDFERIWPAVLVLVGGALIASGQRNQIWHYNDVKNDAKNDAPLTDNSEPETDNATTV